MMKHCLKLLLTFLLCVTSCSVGAAEPATGLVINNPLTHRQEFFSPDLKRINAFKADSKLLKVKHLPEKNEYLLLFQGSSKIGKKANRFGKLVYYNQMFQPTDRRIELPGSVVAEVELKQANYWLIITSQTDKTVLNLVEPLSGIKQQFNLEAPPDLMQLNADGSQLALTVVNKKAATVKLIDLKQLTVKNWPVAKIPGALYFGAANQLIVIESATPNAPKKKAFWKTSAELPPSPAQLTTIDIESGKCDSLPLGTTPVMIFQDQTDPAIFYSVSTIYGVPAQKIFRPEEDTNKSKPVHSTLRVINHGRENAKIELTAVVDQLTQAPSGNLCLLGKSNFFLFDPHAAKLILESGTESKFDGISFSPSGHFGYLSFNQGYGIRLIDLSSGKQLLETGTDSPTLLQWGRDLLNPFSKTTIPAISGVTNIPATQAAFEPVNRHMAINEVRGEIYQISKRSELSVIDFKTNHTISSLKFKDNILGLHLIPHSDYITVATKGAWYLIDPQKSQPLLKVALPVPDYFDGKTHHQLRSCYSPDGKFLAILFEQQLYLINTATCQLVGKIKTDAPGMPVIWLTE
jgi:hypothetical protein